MHLTFSDWMALLTAAGILGSFGLSMYMWLCHSRPKRSVKVGLAFRGEHVRVTFINERGPDVAIEEVDFEDAHGTAIGIPIYSEHDWPVAVPAGLPAHFSFRLESLRHHVKQGRPVPVRAYCRDATGKYYRSANLSWSITSKLFE